MKQERRRYRFRVWDRRTKQIYPVISLSRGGIVVEADDMMRTCLREDCQLMQYSGLRDAGGKEIYEQDILELSGDDEDSKLYLVIFDQGAFRLQPYQQPSSEQTGKSLSRKLIEECHAKVVGNFFQPDKIQ